MFLEEQDSGQTWLLHQDRVYGLGRHPNQDIRFDIPTVSRSHAELFWTEGSWYLRDCSSTYGTYIQDQPIQEQPINPYQWFRLGQEPGVMLRLVPETQSLLASNDQELYYPEPPPSPPFSLDNFRGHSQVRTQLKRYSDLILDADLNHSVQGILLVAGEGRGKRFLARCLADELSQERGISFNFISRDVGKAHNLYQAGKLIKRSLKESIKHAPTVILLQNFDTFYHYLQQTEQFSQTNTGQTTWWNRFWGSLGVADLASEAEKSRQLEEKLGDNLDNYWQWNRQQAKKIIILAAVKNLEILPPEFRQSGGLFSFVLPVPKPDLEGRVAILNKYLHQTNSPLTPELNLVVLAQRLGRIDGHQIAQIVKDAEKYRYETGNPYLDWQHFQPFLPLSTEEIWQQIFLPSPLLQQFQQWGWQWREWDLATYPNSDCPVTLMINGASGTGKTTLSKLLAQDANCELITVTPGKIKSSLVGQSLQNLQNIFAEARVKAPAMLLFDEIDAILPRQDEQIGDPTSGEVINQFLQEIDRLSPSTGVMIVATTNRIEQVEPAVLSRLQEQITLPLPDESQREQMLAYFTLKNPHKNLELAADVDLNYYAQLLIGKSGREIKAIAERVVGQLPHSDLILNREQFDSVLVPKITGELTGVILPERLRKQLTRTLAQFLQAFANPRLTPPAGLLLSGSPGTGKTEIARAMAKLGGIQFQGINAGDVRDKFVGESNRKLARIFAQARRNSPAILFFDEIDGLFPSRGENTAQHEIELVNQFLQEVDGVKHSARGILVVGATNRPEQVDAAVRSRLAKAIAIPLPELPERIELLKLFVGERPVAPQLDWQAVALLLAGKSGRAIKAKVEEAYHLACQEKDEGEITLEHFQQAILGTGDNQNVPELILSPPIRQRVEQTLTTLQNLPQALSLGLDLPQGMLLIGLPGTGKTQIARYLAAKTGWYFRAINPSEVQSPYQGGSLRNLQTIFNDARDRSPCILLFDEIDSLFPRREPGSSNTEVELVNEFLQQIDGAAGIFILATTNRGEAVDPAVISRLQPTLEVPLPGLEERRIMLEQALQKKDWQLATDVNLTTISKLLDGKSGRDIQRLLSRVGQAYIQRNGWSKTKVILTRADFDQILLPPVAIDSSAWQQLILPAEIQQTLQTTLKRFLDFFRNPLPGVTPAPGILLYGPPGTGKTQVARVLAKAAGCNFINLTIAEVRSQYVGEATQKLAQTFAKARRDAPAILFIDEIEALFPQRDSNSPQHEIELINQLLQELDGFRGGTKGVFVVGTTNYVERVDKAVRSRLNKVVELSLPAVPERIAMLRLFTREMNIAPHLDWEKIARLLQGKSGRDLRQLVSEVGQYASDRISAEESLVITTEDFQAVLQAKAPLGELTWDDVILPTQIKTELQRLLKLVANYAHLPPGINPPQGALLCGEPGTGKTQIARVMASVSGLYFKSYSPAEIRSKWVGQSSRNLADVFNQARQNSPGILFFDEIESLFPNRENLGSTGADLENQNLVNQFLQEVDGIHSQEGYLFVLGATNYPQNVDAAVRSRLQREILIPLPGAKEILQLLQVKIHPDWVLDKDVDLNVYAQALVGLSGRDIATAIETSAQLAFDDWTDGLLIIKDRHFRQAFGSGLE
ncbi:MAG: AAA family ATPase [Xenococcaceae cyanobacterium MO_167.B27]|nr:AAA family ATPase [Xenococcaceae cyanobacterium MO_167.B27]